MNRPTTPRPPSSFRDSPGAAALLVLGAAFSVQFGAAIAYRLFPVVGPAATVMLRVVFAATLMAAVSRPKWHRLRTLTRRQWITLASYGVSLAAMNLFFYQALERLPLGPAVTVEFLGPLAVGLAGSRRLTDLVWAGMALLGVAMITGFRLDGLDPAGLVLILCAATAWATYIVLSRRMGAILPGLDALTFGLIIASAVVLPIGLTTAGPGLWQWWVVAAGLGVAVMSSLIPYSTDLVALRRLPTSSYGVLMSLEPGVAALAGLVMLGQVLTVLQWVALALVVVASAGATLTAQPRAGRQVAAGEANGPATGPVPRVVTPTTQENG